MQSHTCFKITGSRISFPGPDPIGDHRHRSRIARRRKQLQQLVRVEAQLTRGGTATRACYSERPSLGHGVRRPLLFLGSGGLLDALQELPN